MRAPHADSSHTAAIAVLTSSSLLQHITSFQRGVLVAVAPLLIRYVAEGHVKCSFEWKWCDWTGYTQQCRIATLLRQRINPGPRWIDLAVPEAIAKYDTSFNTVRIALGACESKGSNALRLRRKLTHLICEAAIAFGRVDMLQWLYDVGAFEWSDASLIPFCIKVAVTHGQVESASWLEKHYGEDVVREVLMSYDMHKIVRHGYTEMVQWMSSRGVGLVPRQSIHYAIVTRNVSLLRTLMFKHPPEKRTTTHAPGCLVLAAIQSGNLEILQVVLSVPSEICTTWLVEKIEGMNRFDMLLCLLSNRKRWYPDWWYLDRAIGRWVESKRMALVAALPLSSPAQKHSEALWKWIPVDQCSEDVIKLLLPHTPEIGIIRTVLLHAAAKKSTMELLYEHSKDWLPGDVAGFVQRVMTQTLGPMASLLGTAEPSEVQHLLPAVREMYSSATRADVRDSILMLVRSHPQCSATILEMDATAEPRSECVDLKFLRLLEELVRGTDSWQLASTVRKRRTELESRASKNDAINEQ